MRVFVLTSLIVLTFTLISSGQPFIDQIRVGQEMPDKINKGGLSEESTENCSCRIFSINYNVKSWEIGGGGAALAETIGIHYNENDSVIGIIEITLRLNNEDAQKVYTSRLSEYMRTQSYFEDRKLLKVRDTDNGVVDGIYYFTFSDYGGKQYTSIGVVENAIIEETYIPKSSYEPRLIN